MKEFIIFLITLAICIFCFVKLGQAIQYEAKWLEVSDNYFVYSASGYIMAEVYADSDDDYSAWIWEVHIKKPNSITKEYKGQTCCAEDAFEQVRKVLFDRYWM